jgi:hypothetical protein
MGAAERRGPVAGRPATGQGPAPLGVVPGGGTRLRVSAARGVYNQVAAERHWERLYSLFETTLRGA